MANNRICLSCGKQYEYCGSCANSRNLPAWKNIFDTETCKDIFECVSDYEQNAITKEHAKEMLSKYDLSKVSMKDKIKTIVNEIVNEDNIENEEKIEPIEAEDKKVSKRKNVLKTDSVD